jgi:WhiB family transcriptional regulator, redox-sensing transcriptional regulator
VTFASLPWPGTSPFTTPVKDEGTWWDDALCAEVDAELFFPDKSGSIVYALRVCALCDVRAECLQFALAHSVDPEDIGNWGVWGGTSAQDRQVMLGRPRKDAAAA